MARGIYDRTKGKSYGMLGKHQTKEAKRKISLATKGPKNPYWKGGKYKSGGYILIWKPKHPFCNKQGYIIEHRLKAEQYLKRYLTREEIVHHINKIRDDNRIRNLIVFTHTVWHMLFHRWGYYNPKYIVFDGRKT